VDLRQVLGLGREHDHGHVSDCGVVSDVHERHPAVDVRHHDIEHDHVDPLPAEHSETLCPVASAEDRHSLCREPHRDHVDGPGIVVDD